MFSKKAFQKENVFIKYLCHVKKKKKVFFSKSHPKKIFPNVVTFYFQVFS